MSQAGLLDSLFSDGVSRQSSYVIEGKRDDYHDPQCATLVQFKKNGTDLVKTQNRIRVRISVQSTL